MFWWFLVHLIKSVRIMLKMDGHGIDKCRWKHQVIMTRTAERWWCCWRCFILGGLSLLSAPTPAQSTCPCQWPQLVGSIVRRKLYRKHKRKNVVNTVVRHRDYNEIAPKCYEFNNSPWKSFFVIARYHGVGSEIVEQCIWWWLEWPLMVSYGVCATQLW